MTEGRTGGGDHNIPDAFLKKRGDNYRQTGTYNTNLYLQYMQMISN